MEHSRVCSITNSCPKLYPKSTRTETMLQISDCSISIQVTQAEACCFGGNPGNRDMAGSIRVTPAGFFLSRLCFQEAIWQHRVSHYNASALMKRHISDIHFEFLKGRFKNMD